MKRAATVKHFPEYPISRVAYEELYQHNMGAGNYDFRDDESWREIRIPPGSSAADVYRLLPSAEDFEYGGYLTKMRIRFRACGPTSADTIPDKLYTFHSHPTQHKYADLPSQSDIYNFLKWDKLRAVTVGVDWIWYWTKDRQNLKTVRKLFAWEEKHMINEIGRLIRESDGDPHLEDSDNDPRRKYQDLALQSLGFCHPRPLVKDPLRWSVHLRESLGIKTTLIRRDVRR